MLEWLIDYRKNAKMTQMTVAKAIGISQPSYCNIERGRFRPDVEHAKAIGALLGFDWKLFYEKNVQKIS